MIEDKVCRTLLDTGSMVSTISEDYYLHQLAQSVELHPLTDILQVEAAGGHQLQYSGYIEVNIRIPETDDIQTALLLVVPSTSYHLDTPVLLGTNVISCCLEKMKEGSEFAYSKKNIPSAWDIANRCMQAYRKQSKRDNGETGIKQESMDLGN